MNPNIKELTLRGMVLGALITVVFTASNVYLGLKVGLTFASSIPAAVISMAVLKFCKDSSILENNMVQTQASSAGTQSSVIFVLPALLMMGYWQGFPFWQTVLVCAAGGLLGVIFTVPLRNAMVVRSELPYPEGVAAAEILKAGHAEGDSGAKDIAFGGIVAAVVSFATGGLRLLADGASFWFSGSSAVFRVPMGFSVALLGAGYLVGIVGGLAMLLGIALAWGVFVPYFTAHGVLPADGDIAAYANAVWKSKVRFIGVGIIGVAALWTLLTLLKPMIEGMKQSFQSFGAGTDAAAAEHERDLSPKAMLATVIVSVGLIALLMYLFVQPVSISAGTAMLLVAVCTLLAAVIGFLVAAACGYMAGLVGSSSSPISGIGILSVVATSLVLLGIGGVSGLLDTADGQRFLTALTLLTGSVVVTVAAIANDNLQDLKTGLLVHASPWRQQFALIVGCIVGALVISPVLELLYNAYGFSGALPRAGMDASQALSAPQATLMMTIADGIFSRNLEWSYIFTGVGLGIAVIIIDSLLKKSGKNYALPPLAVGMGIYLPPTVNAPLIVGAVVAWLVHRHLARTSGSNGEAVKKAAERNGTLFAAGLIVGESLVGVLLAFVIAGSVASGGSDAPLALPLQNWETASEWLGLAAFAVVTVLFAKRLLAAKKQG